MKLFALLPLLSLGAITLAAENPDSFAYVLQADSLAESKEAAIEKLAACGRDWLVLDADYNHKNPWQRVDLDAIRKGKVGRKIVAYVSIGEAETYRKYWKKDWLEGGKRTASAPAWLGEENPDWAGNFRVKYWHAEWQEMMLPVVEDVMKRGFDGVYLDIVDGFESWEFDGKNWISDRLNPETKQSYRRDMVDWVKEIAGTARKVNPAALVIPQNGSQLIANADFLETLSAIGIEDLFTEGDRKQTSYHTKEILPHLEKVISANKPVLLTEYGRKQAMQDRTKKLAQENGLTWLVTDRKLKTLGESGK